MSEMSEKARAAGKEKVKRYTDKGVKVDASGWTEAPCGFMDTQKKLGNRPISKQNLACGGKAAHKHGGRKGRDMGGPASSAGANYVANVPAPPQNRFNFTGQPSPFLGAAGMKKGGKADNWIAGATKHKGALHKELGVPEGKKIPEKKLKKAEHSDNPTERKRADLAVTLKRMNKADGGETKSKTSNYDKYWAGSATNSVASTPQVSSKSLMPTKRYLERNGMPPDQKPIQRASGGQAEEIIGNRPTGGRMPRASGGSAKKGTTVNIIIAQKPEHPPMGPPGMGGMPPKPPGPMPIPGAPPGGAPQGMPAPPPGAPPPMGGPNMPPPSMGRASGGKVYPDMKYASGGGKGRLEKINKYGDCP